MLPVSDLIEGGGDWSQLRLTYVIRIEEVRDWGGCWAIVEMVCCCTTRLGERQLLRVLSNERLMFWTDFTSIN